MRQDSFEYKPLFKIVITTNNLPNIIGRDDGIWRRIHVIPFNAKPREMDKELEHKLAQELSGILNWAIEGCLEWQKSGLPLPQKVKEYSEKYRKDMDQVARFLEEECFIDKKSFISSNSLYFAYKKWSENNGEYQMTSTQLGSELKRKDFEYKRDTKGKREWGFNGLKLNECYMHDDSLPYGAMAQNAEGAADLAPF